jgi:RNA polymerase sigma-70 factor (sigma-E family)
MSRDDDVAALYATHAPRARSLAYLLTGDAAVAEDLVQDCFLRLCSRARRVAPEELGAYLRRMVINASNSHFRRLAVRRRKAADEAGVLGSTGDVGPDATAAWAERDRLRTALQTLPDRQRLAVVLRHWLDLSEAETAEQMGCSVGTVKSLASHGRAALRVRLSVPELEEERSR